MITSLRKAIYNQGLTVSGLSASNFFFKEAPQGITVNHCVFSEISNPYAGRTTMSKFEESYVQFAFYGTDQQALETLVKNLRAKFDDSESSFSLTDYYVLRVDWSLSRDVQLEEVKQLIVQYKFRLQQK
jgi:hypothetical protein